MPKRGKWRVEARKFRGKSETGGHSPDSLAARSAAEIACVGREAPSASGVGGVAGSSSVKRLPWPTVLSTWIWPPCSSRIFRRHRQAQPRAAAAFARDEDREDRLEVVGRDARAVVFDDDLRQLRGVVVVRA